MARSTRTALVGALLFCASSFVLVVALPRLSPFEVTHCVPPGETVCFSGVNPAFPAAFLLSVAGAVLLFFGAFGRGFVVSPVFVAGMIAIAYGLSGVVTAVLDAQRANPESPEVFAPLVAVGALAIWLQTYRRLRGGGA